MVLIRIKTPVGGGQAWSIAHLVSTAGAPRGAFNYRMRHAVDQRTAIRFANLVIQPIRQWCGGNPPIQEREEPTFVKETDANAFRFIQCNRQPTAEDGKWLSDLRDNVYRRITLVNTDTLQITDVGNLSTSSNTYTAENEFIFANDLPFVKRRRNFASFWVLFVLAAVAVLFKLIIRFVSGNDLMRGVGLVVREELGILCCDSMLPRGDIIVHHGPRGLRYEKELPKGAHEADPDRK